MDWACLQIRRYEKMHQSACWTMSHQQRLDGLFSIQLIGKADDNKKTIELKRQLCFDVPAYHVKSSGFQEIFRYLNAHHKRTRYPDIPPKRHISRHSYMWWQVEQKSALVRITTRIACLY